MPPKQMVGMARNGWSASTGFAGRHGPDYARLNREPFEGKVVNRENVGKTADDLVALWNDEHPDDPVSPS